MPHVGLDRLLDTGGGAYLCLIPTGMEFSGACSVSTGSGEDAFLRQNSSHFNGIKFT